MGRQFWPQMALDRALDDLPRSQFHDKVTDALVDNWHEDGSSPKYKELRTVGDLQAMSAEQLATTSGLELAIAEILKAQFPAAVTGEAVLGVTAEQLQAPERPGVTHTMTEVATIPEPPASQTKRKGGWPKGKPRKKKDA